MTNNLKAKSPTYVVDTTNLAEFTTLMAGIQPLCTTQKQSTK